MPFQITWEQRTNTIGLDDRVAVLHDGKNRLEIWPALGFNAYRWQIGPAELLYRSPDFFTENRPSRSGFPILFPFPNRIRDGQFTWPPAVTHPKGEAGKKYTLPTNDPAKKNAIHGFVYQRPWRIVDQGANASSAWVTGEFQGSVDAPETSALWPADYRLRVTYRLFDHVLRVEADADNPDSKPLPFGLGYHPYFALAPFGGPQAVITVGASKCWELVDNLPTGKLLELDERRDLRNGRSYAALQLDDVMTNLFTYAYDQHDSLGMTGVVQHPGGKGMLTLWTSEAFREMVLFTPPHREAICLEPYTCTTDAINLSPRGINAGLKTLHPGEHWQGIVEMHLAY